MLKKVLVAALLVGAVLVGGAATAGAGEWNKNKGYIHSEEDHGGHPARSLCAYSGLDDPDVDPPFMAAMPAKGKVQSPGQFVALFGPDAAGIPGHECRGNMTHG
jgi:hypothetical protein